MKKLLILLITVITACVKLGGDNREREKIERYIREDNEQIYIKKNTNPYNYSDSTAVISRIWAEGNDMVEPTRDKLDT